VPARGAARRCRLDVVAARLGHADPSITLRVYAHVIREQVAEAADVFARAIPPAGRATVSKSVSKKTPLAAGKASHLVRSEVRSEVSEFRT
jgi:hypothetical protein